MKQYNPPKNSGAGGVFSTDNPVYNQIKAAKEKQRSDARRRAEQGLGLKSPAALTTTTPQSEVADKPPTLYTPPKINIPSSFWEVARLLDMELNKVAISQSFILTLWQQFQQSQNDIAELKKQVRQLQQSR